MARPMYADELIAHLTEIKELLELIVAQNHAARPSVYNDLLRKNTYNQSVWRRIQSIGDLRNGAAHGVVSTIDHDDVKDAHNFVQRFITDHPA